MNDKILNQIWDRVHDCVWDSGSAREVLVALQFDRFDDQLDWLADHIYDQIEATLSSSIDDEL